MADARIEAALAIARERFTALSDGETEAFEATQDRHEAACAALDSLRESSGSEDINAIGELIAIEEQTLGLLRQAAHEAGVQLANLRTGEKTAAAYRSVL